MKDRYEFANYDRTFIVGIYPKDWGIGVMLDSHEVTLSAGPFTAWWCFR